MATDPVGAVSTPILANSDTLVVVPVQSQVAYAGVASAVSVIGSDLQIDLSVSPGWTNNQFQSLYFVRFTSGAKAGSYFTVSANTAQSLLVSSDGGSLSGVVAGDKFDLCKYWTLNTLLPYNDAAKNPLTVSGGTGALARRSQVIIPDNSFSGINLPAAGTYYFTSGGWRKVGDTVAFYNDTILLPDEHFIIRQPAAVTLDTSLTMVGGVNVDTLVVPMATRVAGAQDNALGFARPADVSLAASGLASGFVASAGTGALARRDQLLVFDNSIRGFNKSAARTYFMVGTQWRKVGAVNDDASADVLPAGSALIVRKYQTAGGAIANWTNQPNY